MPFIEWDRRFATGLPEVDNQHVALFELVNYLHEVGTEGVSPSQMQEAVGDLVVYADGHFRMEEAFMSRHAKDELPAHKEAHDALRAAASDYAARCPADPQRVCIEMAEVLKAWLIMHVLDVDLRLSRYVNSRAA
jgi:hemerythrin-like metal-binding protein